MKKTLLLTTLMLLSIGGAVSAEEAETFPRHYLEVRVGDPLVAEFMSSIFGNGHYYPLLDPIYAYTTEKGDIWTGHYTQPYRKSGYTLPSFSLAYHYAVRPWLQVGPVVSYYGFTNRYYDRGDETHLYNRGVHFASVLADVRFQYFNRPKVGLYSGVGLGFSVGTDYRSAERAPIGAPAWQVTALGLRVGDRVYWNMELGFGVEGFGQTGIGCRF